MAFPDSLLDFLPRVLQVLERRGAREVAKFQVLWTLVSSLEEILIS